MNHLRREAIAMVIKHGNDDIYTLLGIHATAPADMVKKRFKEFALEHHPDIHPGDRKREELFKRVCAAYQTWKLINTTIEHIRRMRSASTYAHTVSDDFRPWHFSCTA
ncbi:MAG: J domain-containing protein [Desulfobacterota bacterium]|nr:J domain-containing protein [Thermodesulfobacteriota bacterium]